MAAAAAPPAATIDSMEARTFDAGAGHTLPYRIFVPSGATVSTPRPVRASEKLPLVLFLHGAGGRGTDNRKQITDQTAPLVFISTVAQVEWPAFMVAPQCPPDQQWVAMPWGERSGKGKRPAAPTWPLAAAVALIDKLIAEYPTIDSKRIYITGISMGGFGTFDAAARWPAKWKAAVPICGGYDETQVGSFVTLPLWAFHAADDPTVPVSRTRAIIEALRARGGRPRYTEYPASARHGHFSWIPAYADPQLLPWMFGKPPLQGR